MEDPLAGFWMLVWVSKDWIGWSPLDEVLPHAEFTFNRAPSKATRLSPFQVVYGYNPRIPLDLIPLPTHVQFSWEAEKRAKEIKDLTIKLGLELKRLMSTTRLKPTRVVAMFNSSPGT